MMRAALVLALAASAAEAAPHHCLDEPGARLVLDETLVGVINPPGGENQLQLYLCWPLVERPGLLFDYTNVEAGLYNNASPIYVQQGVFASVTPLSLLVLRAEVAGVQYWPLPLNGAGFFSVTDYHAAYDEASLPAARASAATGVEAAVSATLQGEVALSPRFALAAVDTINPEYWAVSHGAYWVNDRRDVILAHSDWLVRNTALLLAEIKRSDTTVRVGFSDDLTSVPRAGYIANIVGGIAMIDFRHPTPSLHEVSGFLRVGDYTDHAFRHGVNLFFGVSAVWERLRP